MCGRFSFFARRADIARAFPRLHVSEMYDLSNPPRYNIAPTQLIATISNEAPERLTPMRWGLIPRWAKDASTASHTINARVETLAQKPSFREPLRSRRCLIPADGYYEWQRTPSGKRPMRIVARKRELFAFAGLWDRWADPEAQAERVSCSIITCAAPENLRAIHNRAPVILGPEAYEPWLARTTTLDDLHALLLAPRFEAFEAYAVSSLVNNARYDGPAIIEAAP